MKAINGEPVVDRLAQKAQAGKIDDEGILRAVFDDTSADLVNTPLSAAVHYFADNHGIPPIVLDQYLADPQQPITAWSIRGVPLSAALTLVLQPHGLAADYRYGRIWITTEEDADMWRDETGIGDITPLPGSSLDLSWNERTLLNVLDVPLADALSHLERQSTLAFDTSALDGSGTGQRRATIVASRREHPIRHILGMLLEQTNCRCELRGETLVILPPQE